MTRRPPPSRSRPLERHLSRRGGQHRSDIRPDYGHQSVERQHRLHAGANVTIDGTDGGAKSDTGTGANVSAFVGSDGTLSGLLLSSIGSGYTHVPLLTIAAPRTSNCTAPSCVAATAAVTSMSVMGITVTLGTSPATTYATISGDNRRRAAGRMQRHLRNGHRRSEHEHPEHHRDGCRNRLHLADGHHSAARRSAQDGTGIRHLSGRTDLDRHASFQSRRQPLYQLWLCRFNHSDIGLGTVSVRYPARSALRVHRRRPGRCPLSRRRLPLFGIHHGEFRLYREF